MDNGCAVETGAFKDGAKERITPLNEFIFSLMGASAARAIIPAISFRMLSLTEQHSSAR